MRCDFCGVDRYSSVLVQSQQRRYAVCSDCIRLIPLTFWSRKADERSIIGNCDRCGKSALPIVKIVGDSFCLKCADLSGEIVPSRQSQRLHHRAVAAPHGSATTVRTGKRRRS